MINSVSSDSHFFVVSEGSQGYSTLPGITFSSASLFRLIWCLVIVLNQKYSFCVSIKTPRIRDPPLPTTPLRKHGNAQSHHDCQDISYRARESLHAKDSALVDANESRARRAE